MPGKIGRSIGELNQEIKNLTSEIKKADNEVKSLDKNLKLNPGNVADVKKKYELLEKELQSTASKMQALRKKEEELDNEHKNGALSEDKYATELAKLQKQIRQTEEAERKLTEQIKRKGEAIRSAQLENLSKGLDRAEQKAAKLSHATLAAATAFIALTKAAIDNGDKLNDTANHYSTTVENLQLWENRLGMLAGNTDAYTAALASVGSMQSSIVAGRGGKYLTYLNKLGIAQADLNGKSNGEIFDMIYQGLRNVSNETERATIAQGLFGDNGLEIAIIANTEQDAINDLDNALIQNGIITTEQAQAADAAANRILELKQQFQATSAELLLNAQPAFEAFCGLLNNTVIPLINGVSSFLGGMNERQQKSVLIMMMLLILLPKIIAFAKMGITVYKGATVAIKAMAAAQAGLNTVSAPYIIIIGAILVLVMALFGWLNKLSSASKTASASTMGLLDNLGGIQSQAAEMESQLAKDTEITFQGNSNKSYDLNLNVNATGDGTSINRENAENIASALEDRLLTDLVNQGLGEKIRGN